MRGWWTRAAGVALVALAAIAQVSAASASRGLPRHGTGGLSVRLSGPTIDVVVQLAGKPVTLRQAATRAPLSVGYRAELATQLAAKQTAVARRVSGLGGLVEARYQYVYDGIKARVSPVEVPALERLPGVVGVHILHPVAPADTDGVPLLGVPQVWGGLSRLNGRHVKIGIIDSGIDYTHADFGGPGTPGAYQQALADDTLDPTLPGVCMTSTLAPCFGPSAPRVKGGVDLVGDAYNASDPNNNTPHPDANPLDCLDHGTHVAGIATGSGVLANGHTYTGTYTATTIANLDWEIGPGVAPAADIYAIKVFGCRGSTFADIDGMEWAAANGMQVVNLSLGTALGSPDDPAAVAATNLAASGVVVVISAGNSGSQPYVVGEPSTGNGVLSVAAEDPASSLPAATLSLAAGGSATGLDMNDAPFAQGRTMTLQELTNPDGSLSLGCNAPDYSAQNVTGKLVVTLRGTCPLANRAVYAQEAGAIGVIIVNSSSGFPPVVGPLNTTSSEPIDVTIPLLGVQSGDEAALLAATASATPQVTLGHTSIPNPGFETLASFTSGGPRIGDNFLEPAVTAPGVSILSAGMGTGSGAASFSGTSMAAPFVTGLAALVREAHPSWAPRYVDAAIANTADPALVASYNPRLAGTGLVQAQPAVGTEVVASGADAMPALNFGYYASQADYSRTLPVAVRNLGNAPASFDVSTAYPGGAPHTVSVGAPEVTIPAHGTVREYVMLSVPIATAPTADAFGDVSGQVVFTPTDSSQNGNVTLRVPYYLVPRALANVQATLADPTLAGGSSTVTLTNPGGAAAGNSEFFALGLLSPSDSTLGSDDVRAVGVAAPFYGLDFAISTYKPWTHPDEDEFAIWIDANGDGIDDYVVFNEDAGYLGGTYGRPVSVVQVIATGNWWADYYAVAPPDATTMILPISSSRLCEAPAPCIDSSNPRFTYHVESFGGDAGDVVPGTASFNALNPSLLDTGQVDGVAIGATVHQTVGVNGPEFALTPAKGYMVVTRENRAGTAQAQLFTVHP